MKNGCCLPKSSVSMFLDLVNISLIVFFLTPSLNLPEIKEKHQVRLSVVIILLVFQLIEIILTEIRLNRLILR